MTAINVALQPLHRCLHIVTDGATYDSAGVVNGIGTKVYTAPNWPGALALRGIAKAVPLLGQALSYRFQSFDELVAGIEKMYSDLIESFGFSDENIELIIAGWSFERDRPESYVIYPNEQLAKGMTAEKLAARKAAGEWVGFPDPYKLIRLPEAMLGPFLNAAGSAEFEGIDLTETPEKCIARMHQAIECQRHDIHEHTDVCFIGGFAQLATITPDGISQRILSRWPDKLGEKISPAPLDWDAWRAKHWKCFGFGQEKPDVFEPVAGSENLSRLRRDRLAKKQMKAAKRAVNV